MDSALIRKLRVLELELLEEVRREEVPDLGTAVHGPRDRTGSRWDSVSRYLSPDVLLRLDRTQSRVLHATMINGDIVSVLHDPTPQAVAATVLELEEAPASPRDLREAYRVLERSISQRLNGAELSSTQSALHKVARALKLV